MISQVIYVAILMHYFNIHSWKFSVAFMEIVIYTIEILQIIDIIDN